MSKINLDKIGASASFACFIHCTLLPIIFIFLPYAPLAFMLHGNFEIILLLTSVLIGLLSSCRGYSNHKNYKPALTISIGLLLLIFGHIIDTFSGLHAWHLLLMIFAAFMLISGHIINNKLCHDCKKCN